MTEECFTAYHGVSLGKVETKEDLDRLWNYYNTLDITEFIYFVIDNYEVRTQAIYDFLGLVPPTNENNYVKIT